MEGIGVLAGTLGSSATTRVPRPEAESISSVPPISSMRSHIECRPNPLPSDGPSAASATIGRVEATAVVLDDERNRAARRGDVDGRRRRARVLAHVRERLLDDPDDLDLVARREHEVVPEVRLKRRGDPALAAVLVQVGAQAVEQVAADAAGLAQVEDRPAGVAVALVADVCQLDQLQRDRRRDGVLARGERAQPQVHRSENLREAVVQLAGEPLPLGEDRALPFALAHSGAGHGDRGDVGEGLQKLPMALLEGDRRGTADPDLAERSARAVHLDLHPFP